MDPTSKELFTEKRKEKEIETERDKVTVDIQTELPKEEVLEKEEKKIDNNLMFEQKRITIFKLYLHISGGLEMVLTIIAIIMTIGAGCSSAIMTWVFGDSSNNFTLAT